MTRVIGGLVLFDQRMQMSHANNSSILQSAFAWCRRFGLMLAAVVIALLIRENYPFSHNPMYSKFDPYTYFLHVTDENDKVLFFREEFGFSAIRLKKVFSKIFKEVRKDPTTANLSREEHWRIAGERTLEQYHRQRRPRTAQPTSYSILKLVRTDIELGEEKVESEVRVIADINVPREQSL